MKVEIWSDIACPWCYIGRRRFESALSEFDHSDQIEVTWRSFQLDPSAPLEYDGNVNDLLSKKYGMSVQQAQAANDRVTMLAEREGLEYHLENAHPVNSFDAHRLIHLAAHHGLQSEMKERLQLAYFTEGEVVSNHETLVRLGGDIGLDQAEIRTMLEGNDYTDSVNADIRRARMLQISGVPFFLIDEKFAISGAQETSLFLSGLNRAWQESHPVVQLVGADSSDGVCTDDSCAV